MPGRDDVELLVTPRASRRASMISLPPASRAVHAVHTDALHVERLTDRRPAVLVGATRSGVACRTRRSAMPARSYSVTPIRGARRSTPAPSSPAGDNGGRRPRARSRRRRGPAGRARSPRGRRRPPRRARRSGNVASGSAAAQATSSSPSRRARRRPAVPASSAAPRAVRRTARAPVMLDRLRERRVGETGEIGECRGAQARSRRAVGPRPAVDVAHRAGAVEGRLSRHAVDAVLRRVVRDRRRPAARRCVASSTRQSGAIARPSSIAPATRPEQLGVAPESSHPASARRAASRVVVLVPPLAERGLERRFPAADRSPDALREERQLGLDDEPHRRRQLGEHLVGVSPSAGAGRGRSCRPRRPTEDAPSIVTVPSPGCSTVRSSRFATTCGSSSTVSRASTGPAGTPRRRSRSTHVPTGSARYGPRSPSVSPRLPASTVRIVRDQVRRVDRLVVEPEAARATPAAGRR